MDRQKSRAIGVEVIMKLDRNGCLLRILIGEGSKHKGKPLYEWLVLRARELGLAGATVTRGVMGFGANSRIHTAKILRLSEDLPIVIEIVDTREKIERYLEYCRRVYRRGAGDDRKGRCPLLPLQ